MDMERIRDGIRVGRVKFSAGDVDLAARIWKKALEGAYETQDYAAMFVLSKNLGDACAKEAQLLRLSNVLDAVDALQRGVDYYNYALNVIDACALKEVLGDDTHLLLNRNAGKLQARVQMLTLKLEKLRKLPPPIEKKLCTTCEELFEELVLDENDGCEYCQRCYDAYYATAAEQEDAIVNETENEEDPVDTRTTLVDEDTSLGDSRSSEGEQHIEKLASTVENGQIDERNREESVEIVHNSDATEQLHDIMEELVSEDLTMADDELTSEEATSDATALASEGVEEQHQPVAPQPKITYSIPTLLSLRAQTPSECPRALRSCPVRVDSVTPTSRSTSNGVDRKGGAKHSARR
ncbi:hypothetical protein FI667_g6618, partial [Globisporangium splendens]